MSGYPRDRRVKAGRLLLRWAKHPPGGGAPDFVVSYPSRPDGALVIQTLCGTAVADGLVAELERRGYDTSTLRFQVDKKESTDVAG